MSLRKRYEKPDKLADLLGPEQGTITLPIELYWQPGGSVFQVEDDADLATAYRSVLNEGSKEDLCRFLNAKLLIKAWPSLLLPPRLVREWENTFSELPHNKRGEEF